MYGSTALSVSLGHLWWLVGDPSPHLDRCLVYDNHSSSTILPLPYDARMDLKLSNLSIRDRGPNGLPNELPRNSASISPDRYLEKLKNYAKSLPYSIESNSKMLEMLDFICLRLYQCIEAKDFDPGFAQWDSMVT
jgi:hypothetical protein